MKMDCSQIKSYWTQWPKVKFSVHDLGICRQIYKRSSVSGHQPSEVFYKHQYGPNTSEQLGLSKSMPSFTTNESKKEYTTTFFQRHLQCT